MRDSSSGRLFFGSLLLATITAAVPIRSAVAQNAWIFGQVISAEDSNPIPGANVFVVSPDSRLFGAATDATGQYRITGLGPGPFTLTATFVGYEDATVDGIVLGEGEPRRMDIALEPGLVFEDEVVVTSVSKRVEKAVDAPAAVSVLESREIVARPVLTMAEHLKSVPGVDAATTGLMQTRVAVRGFNNVIDNADRLLLLTDYRNTRFPSVRINMFQLIPTINEDVDRVEIVRGPGSALYGPNAANGVVNVITKSPFSSRGSDFMFGIGERNLITGSFRHAGVLGSQVGYKVSGRYYQGDDWDYVDPLEPARRDNDVQNGAVDGRIDYQASDELMLSVAGGWARTTSTNLTVAGAARYVDAAQTYIRTGLHYRNLFAQAFWNLGNLEDGYLLRTGQPLVEKSSLIVGQIQNTTEIVNGDQRFTYGLDAFLTRPKTEDTIHGQNEDSDNVDELGGYIQSETQVSQALKLVGAIRLDKHSRIDDLILSPRAAVVLKPLASQTFRATYNRAYTTPSATAMFLDLTIAPSLGPLPYPIQGYAIPETGFNYRRDAGGGIDNLYMQSPFNPAGAGQFLPASGVSMWDAVVALLQQQGVDISGIPAPGPDDVSTQLAALNSGTGAFDPVDPTNVMNLGPAGPTTTNTLEAGYKGLLGSRVFATADVYYTQVSDMISSLTTFTPSVFMDRGSLESYLAPFVGADQARELAVAIGEIPLGTVTPDETGEVHPSAIVLAYENYDDSISLWGSDLSLTYVHEPSWIVRANYSYVSKHIFPSQGNRKEDIALNAPRHKAGVSVQYIDEEHALDGQIRVRYVGGFPVIAGVYFGQVEPYAVVDLNASWAIPFSPQTRLKVSIQNALDNRHAEFVGAPEIGRLTMIQLETHL